LDENVNLWQHPNYSYHDVLFSWNIISEGIRADKYNTHGALIGDGISFSNPVYNTTFHHNLIAHNADRNPRIKGSSEIEVINNVVYNWYWMGTLTGGKSAYIGNHYIAGPDTSANDWFLDIQDSNYTEALPDDSVYLSHNIGPGRLTDTGDEWNIVVGGPSGPLANYRTNTPPFTLSGVTVDDVSTVKSAVLDGVGATVPSRDSVDTRVINNVNSLGGGLISSQSAVGGWPTLAEGTYPGDTDGDGMPDAWETANGLNPNVVDSLTYAASGYLWIEEYINSFFIPSAPAAPVVVFIE
jgi:hypothetical protein